MTTHPEDAMTREQVLEEAAGEIEAAARGVTPGLNYTAVAVCAGLHALAGQIRALASTRQEPAPSADAEEVAKFAFKIACDWGNSQCSPLVADAIRKDRALRRYAGDGGVTDAMVEAACKAYESVTEEMRGIDPKDMRAALEAAARAKSSEKDGAR